MAKILTLILLIGMCLAPADPPPLGLTERTRPLNAALLKQLSYIGIAYTFHVQFPHPLKKVLYQKKEEALRKWFRLSRIRPGKSVLLFKNRGDPRENIRKNRDLLLPSQIGEWRYR